MFFLVSWNCALVRLIRQWFKLECENEWQKAVFEQCCTRDRAQRRQKWQKEKHEGPEVLLLWLVMTHVKGRNEWWHERERAQVVSDERAVTTNRTLKALCKKSGDDAPKSHIVFSVAFFPLAQLKRVRVGSKVNLIIYNRMFNVSITWKCHFQWTLNKEEYLFIYFYKYI